MLAATNDAFVGIAGTSTPFLAKEISVVVYDAGREANTELCIDVPALPCAEGRNQNLRVTEGAEGFIHIHNGIHGVGDLNAANMDWRNPVVKVRIKRIK
ncbi:spondin domain-containing protein [Malonomonas rubra]|uniref:spondin domain-containing protein n=1 Tax=Malonomonas rubra TaxID=57040 RepID=UPI0026F30DC4|nr:spondin domain-containing protein [Malonomonas rubra]